MADREYDYLDKREFEFSSEDFEQARDDIVLRLRAQISRIKWDEVEAAKIRAERDPQIQRAMELFDEAERLARRASRIELNEKKSGKLKDAVAETSPL